MRMRHRQSLLRQVIATSALSAALGFVVLGLSQCRGMDDPMGVSRSNSATSNGISDCVQRCNDVFKQCRDKENARHSQAVKQCNQIKDPVQREACLAAEETLHEQNIATCAAAMNLCKERCRYREGSGSGGR